MYITPEELKEAIGFQAAVMATLAPDEEGAEEGSGFLAVLTEVIQDQTKLINDWTVSEPEDLPALETNQILRRICLNLCRYEMYVRFARDMVPETVQADKDEAIKMLRDIQRGELKLQTGTAELLEISEYQSRPQMLDIPLY